MKNRAPAVAARGVLALLGLVSSLSPSATRAADLTLGSTAEYAFTSNFFSSSEDEDEASSFAIGPTLALTEDRGRLAYELGYNGAYQVYVDQDGVNNWESFASGRVSYELDSRTTLRLSDRFRDVSNLRFGRQDIALADTALDPNQDRYLRNVLELELTRELSRRLELEVAGAHYWTDFRENVDRNDSQAFGARSELRYQIADRHDVGVGGSYLHQEFEDALARFGSTSDTASGYVIWDWRLSDTVVFSATGGPSWIRSEYDEAERVTDRQFVGGRLGDDLFRASLTSCEVDPRIGLRTASNCDLQTNPIAAGDLGPRESFDFGFGEGFGVDSVVTGFGAASIQAALGSWNLEAAYSRRQSTTSGGGLASSLDQVYAEAEFAPPNLRFSPFVAASWDLRETLTEATIVDFTVVAGAGGAAERSIAFTRTDDRAERRESVTAIGGVRTAFTRHQSATFEFRYRRTEGRDQGVSQPSADIYFAVVTFAYTLDPIQF